MKLGSLPHFRAYAIDGLTLRDGRLLGRVVPYNRSAKVLDELPDGTVDIYAEGFRPGAFARQVTSTERSTPHRIDFVHSHDGGLGYLGHGSALLDHDDGLWTEFRVIRSQRENVEDLLAEGIEALSIEYRDYPDGTEIDGDGVRWRTAAHLDRVALEPKGAYTEARVLAYRAELDELAAVEAATAEAARAEAEEAATRAAAEAGEAAAAEERARRVAEMGDFLAAETARQAELEARYLSNSR